MYVSYSIQKNFPISKVGTDSQIAARICPLIRGNINIHSRGFNALNSSILTKGTMYWQRTFPPLLARGLSTIYLLPIYCRLIRLLITEIGAPKCTNLLLSIYVCFLTGFASAASFSTYFVWRSFQTGNAAQLGLSRALSTLGKTKRTINIQ